MKNVAKISILTATMTVALTFFGGCSKDDLPSLVSGGFNGRISATVDPEDWDLSPIRYVVAWNDPEIDMARGLLLGEQMGDEVSYSNNKFSINLPDPLPSKIEMVEIKDAFENMLNISGSLKYSNPKVMIADVDFLAHTNSHFVGFFYNATADKKTTCVYVYADGDVTVTGGSNISVSLKAGWNRIYHTEGGNGKYTTKAPEEELKWYYDNF